jgi:hypothetical protein
MRDEYGWRLEIVSKPSDQAGFVVHPRRWVVERPFAWLGTYRRLSKDYEELWSLPDFVDTERLGVMPGEGVHHAEDASPLSRGFSR